MKQTQSNRTADTERVIRTLEAEVRNWPKARWFAAAVFIIAIVSLSIADCHFANWVEKERNDRWFLPRPEMEVTGRDLEIALNVESNWIIIRTMVGSRILPHFILSFIFLAYLLFNWNKHKRSSVLLRLLKEHYPEQDDPTKVPEDTARKLADPQH
jgi:hypothetical protein